MTEEVRTSSKEMMRRIARRTKIPQKTVASVMTAFAEEVGNALLQGEVVIVRGVGRLRRKCYTARNCPTLSGKRVTIVRHGVALKTSGALLNRLKEGKDIFDEVEQL